MRTRDLQDKNMFEELRPKNANDYIEHIKAILKDIKKNHDVKEFTAMDRER